MWVQFVIGSCLALRVFSRLSGFPPSTKTNISKFQFDQDRGPTWRPGKACMYPAVVIWDACRIIQMAMSTNVHYNVQEISFHLHYFNYIWCSMLISFFMQTASRVKHIIYVANFFILYADLSLSFDINYPWKFHVTPEEKKTIDNIIVIVVISVTWFSTKVPTDFNPFIYVTCDYFFFAFLMAASCKAELAWNEERFLLHLSFIYVVLLFCYLLPTPPPPLYYSIGVKLSSGYTCLKFSSEVNSQQEPTDWRSLTAV